MTCLVCPPSESTCPIISWTKTSCLESSIPHHQEPGSGMEKVVPAPLQGTVLQTIAPPTSDLMTVTRIHHRRHRAWSCCQSVLTVRPVVDGCFQECQDIYHLTGIWDLPQRTPFGVREHSLAVFAGWPQQLWTWSLSSLKCGRTLMTWHPYVTDLLCVEALCRIYG